MKLIHNEKTLILILVLVFLSVATYAQKGMNIQISVGPGMSMGGKFEVPSDIISINPNWTAMKKSFTFGMDAGASFGYNFADEMGVSMGLFYSKQGQRYKDYTWILGSDFVTWSRSVSLNYLKIPIQFNYILHPKQKISFTASAGFYLSFLLGYVDKNSMIASDGSDITATAKGKTYTMSSGSLSETADFKNGKPYKSADFGFLLGAGVQFNLTDKISIPLGLFYQVGFIDVKNKTCQYTDSSGDSYLFWQDSDDTNPNGTLAYHNSSLELKIGVKINL